MWKCQEDLFCHEIAVLKCLFPTNYAVTILPNFCDLWYDRIHISNVACGWISKTEIVGLTSAKQKEFISP